MANEHCIFCQIVSGELPCHKIWEDQTHLAFLSIFPNTDGFSVVIPKTHLDSYAFDNTDEALSQLIIATKQVAKILDAHFSDVARCGMFFEGYGVDHLHSKLFPMHGTKMTEAEWKPIESLTNDTFYHQYPGFLSSNNSHRADDVKLAQLAADIRATSQKFAA